MVLKKPSILLYSYGSFQNIHCPYQSRCNQTPAGPHSHGPRSATQATGRRKAQWRHYADVRPEGSSSQGFDDLCWPDLSSATTVPTPYQIFKLAKGAPYSKRRFYELVKLYHPDRYRHDEDSSSSSCLSRAVKLERYRLIVAANDILSDPVRRSAYDKYGSGWNDRPNSSWKRHDWGPNSDWTGFDHNSAARNATWEDWEKWYQRDPKRKQEPLYFSNGGFFSLIVFFAILGGMGQVTRVGDVSRTFLEQVEGKHDESSKDLQRRRKETHSFNNKDERMHSFLKGRDPIGYGIIDPKEEGYRRLLPEPEVCMSNDIKGRALDKNPGKHKCPRIELAH